MHARFFEKYIHLAEQGKEIETKGNTVVEQIIKTELTLESFREEPQVTEISEALESARWMDLTDMTEEFFEENSWEV